MALVPMQRLLGTRAGDGAEDDDGDSDRIVIEGGGEQNASDRLLFCGRVYVHKYIPSIYSHASKSIP